ncbi:11310_t:CDS:1, partial [Entrophospora sp. SA101]
LETGLAFMGITSQSCSKSYFQYQGDYYDPIKNMAREVISSALNKVIEKSKEEGKKNIPCSFDVSWSHVRNAPQASGELIYDGYIETSRYKPVIAFSICEKSRTITKEGKNITTHEGNFDQSSRQMEHQILIDILEEITPIFRENNLLLDIAIDGDLDSNKTLSKYNIVNQIFTDLKHKTKTIRNKINNGKYKKWENFEKCILDYY